MSKQIVPLSRYISEFLNTCSGAQKAHKYNYDNVGECDKRTTDFSHAIEFGDYDYAGRNKLTTAERKNRQDRRRSKDIVETHTPLTSYLGTPAGRQFVKDMQKVLGETRKVEKKHENRFYRKRAQEG